jgi:hypothetical protein
MSYKDTKDGRNGLECVGDIKVFPNIPVEWKSNNGKLDYNFTVTKK